MGLGSDSQPVHVAISGHNTYFVDSMQCALKYALRVEQGLKGTYYIGSSFRGENPDDMHLNQFYHAECEMLGTLTDAIDVAKRYIIAVTRSLLNKHIDTIRAVAGTTSHVDFILSLANKNPRHFPRITLSDAFSLKEIMDTTDTWQYVVPSDHSKGRVLTRVGERVLIERFGGIVWLTEMLMDHLSVPFYQAFVPDTDRAKALCADLLLGFGETLGHGQRHARAEELRMALEMHKVPMEKYEW
ncbi:MAG: hypothetical protein Q9167_002798 [Letrouitia subvulpina]